MCNVKTVRCSDDSYALIAERASQRRIPLAQAVDELVSGQLSADYGMQLGLGVEEVAAVMGRFEQLEQYVYSWQNILLGVIVDVGSICHHLGIKTDRDLEREREAARRPGGQAP